MTVLWWIFAATILTVLGLVAWVIWLNWYDHHSEKTIGRDFDHYYGAPEEPKRKRFRDDGEE